ncbi:MAG: hypothetical protein AAF411_13425 [Myxococcota bacterium]
MIRALAPLLLVFASCAGSPPTGLRIFIDAASVSPIDTIELRFAGRIEQIEPVREIVLALPDEGGEVRVELDALRNRALVGTASVRVEARIGEVVETQAVFAGVLCDEGASCESRADTCVSSEVLREYEGVCDAAGSCIEVSQRDVRCECRDGACETPCEGSDCPCEGSDCPCEGDDCPCEGNECCFDRVGTLSNAFGSVAAAPQGDRLEGVFGSPLVFAPDLLAGVPAVEALGQNGGSVHYARFRDTRFAMFEVVGTLSIYRRLHTGGEWQRFNSVRNRVRVEPVPPRFHASVRPDDIRLYWVADPVGFTPRVLTRQRCAADSPDEACALENDFTTEIMGLSERVRILDIRPDPADAALDLVLVSTEDSLLVEQAQRDGAGLLQWMTELADGRTTAAFANASSDEPRVLFTGIAEGSLWVARTEGTDGARRVAADVAPDPSSIATAALNGRHYAAYPVLVGGERTTRIRVEESDTWRVLTDLDGASASAFGTLPQLHVLGDDLYVLTADGDDAGIHRLNAAACFDGG